MIIAAFVIAMLFMYRAVVAPVRRLTAATQQISLGKAADLGLAKISPEQRQRAAPAGARHRAAARVDQHGDPAAVGKEAGRIARFAAAGRGARRRRLV